MVLHAHADERTDQRGRRIVPFRKTTLAPQHRHIQSSSLFKHAHHRMIVDGFHGAATMNNR
jgi:hypothetical protein